MAPPPAPGLLEILSNARDDWRKRWKDTLDDIPDPYKRADKRSETWRAAVMVALGIAESKPVAGLRNPASEDFVRSAELIEIACRRRLLDSEFQKRFDKLFAIVSDPDRLDDTDVLSKIARNEGIYFLPPSPKRPGERSLAGLAISGGGIRSATFGLGVLQALAHLKLLSYFDYLSTVSGGGYIGAWFAAWLKREDPDLVFQALDPEERRSDEAGSSQDPIRFLRQYSNYLTPQLGFLSRDTWAMATIYFRNTMLNLITLVAFVGAVMLVPRCTLWIQNNWGTFWDNPRGIPYNTAMYGAAFFTLVWMLCSLQGFTCKPMEESRQDTRRRRWFREQSWVDWLITIPALLTAILSTGHIWVIKDRITSQAGLDQAGPFRWVGAVLVSLFVAALIGRWNQGRKRQILVIASAILGGGLFLMASFRVHAELPLWIWLSCAISLTLWFMGWVGGYWECFYRQSRETARRWQAGLLLLFLSSVAGFTAGAMLRSIAALFRYWADTPWHLTIWATPLMLANFCLVTFLYMGLLGINFPDERREWISRLSGRLLLAALVWSLLFSFAFYVPPLMGRLDLLAKKLNDVPLKSILAGVWSAITWISVQAARSPKTGRASAEADAQPSQVLDLFARVGPYVFVFGLFAAVSFGVSTILQMIGPASHSTPSYMLGQSGPAWLLLAICAIVMGVFSGTVDVNEFSMHHFYRNRLIRAYLGASNAERNPNGFTGFDSRDDVPLALFAPTQTTAGVNPYLGPYPIVNASLNLTTGKYLAYQERKAESFIFTPLFCGVDTRALIREKRSGEVMPAYRPTKEYAYPAPGIHIGSAIAISGAFASPNMGYHSSPATAFLLTVFNVRLGWWIGNPGEVKAAFGRGMSESWRQSSPNQGLAYTLKDLFGASDDESDYVYLTDGGHFDNMGLYELVRRRCRFIVVSDAEEDQAFGFEGLGGAIRKCRADFGIEIEIDVEQIRPKAGQKQSTWHCVVGTIHYEHVDRDFGSGILVYLKSSLTGDEPSDLLQYSLRKAEFPHQTTLDQFFDESQFESYRRLGYHVGVVAFKTAKERADTLNSPSSPQSLALHKRDLFNMMQARWYPPSPANESAFTKHAEHLNVLHDRLRTSADLGFLVPQFFPEWLDLESFSRTGLLRLVDSGLSIIHPPGSELSLPSRPAELRAGFFYCTELIQLMESVYLDLNLDRYHDHPDNQGWMNLFQHWTYSEMLRTTWVITASTYGMRFNLFCRHQLGLINGEVALEPMNDVHLTNIERKVLEPILAEFPNASREFLMLQTRPADPADKTQSFCLRFGFVLIADRRIVYMRVRRHLRRVGLGKFGLRHLLVHDVLDRKNPIIDHPPIEPLGLSEDALRKFRMLVDSVNPG